MTLLLTLALTLSMSVAVTAQEEDAAFDPAMVPEFQQDEALAAYLLFEEELLAAQMVADREGDDGEFGKAEGEEVIGGDDDVEEDDG